MARRPITSLQDLAEEFGLDHQLATELFRRVQRTVFEGNDVIVQEFGTFYHRQTQARPRVLNGTTYNVPAKESVGLKAPRFPGRVVSGLVLVIEAWSRSEDENIPPYFIRDEFNIDSNEVLYRTPEGHPFQFSLSWGDMPVGPEARVTGQEEGAGEFRSLTLSMEQTGGYFWELPIGFRNRSSEPVQFGSAQIPYVEPQSQSAGISRFYTNAFTAGNRGFVRVDLNRVVPSHPLFPLGVDGERVEGNID